MFSPLSSRTHAFGVVLLLICGPVVAVEPALPKGAVARLGSDQFRHGGMIFQVSYTQGGKALLTAGHDQTLRLWDAATGQELRRFERPGKDQPLGELFDKDLLEELNKKGVSFEGTRPGMALPLFQSAATAEGDFIAATRNRTLFVWDGTTGKLLHTIEGGFRLPIGLTFASDGKTLALLDAAMTVTIWTVADGKKLRTVESKGVPSMADFLSQGLPPPVLTEDLKTLAWAQMSEVNNDTNFFRRDLATGKKAPPIKMTKDGSDHWCLSPNGKTLAWQDPSTASFVVCDLDKPAKKRKLKPKAEVDLATGMQFSPDGQSLLVRRYGRGLELWDAARATLTWSHPGFPNLLDEEGFDQAMGRASGAGLAFAPDGKTMAVSFGSPRLLLYDSAGGKPIAGPDKGHLAGVIVLGPCQKGKAVMTYAPGDGVKMWDAVTGKSLPCPLKLDNTWAASLSADGTVVATIEDDGVKVWDVQTGKEIAKIKNGANSFEALDLSHDGKVLALHTEEGQGTALYSTDTGKLLRHVQGGGGAVPRNGADPNPIASLMAPDLVFSPDSRYLAGPGADLRLQVWHAATGNLAWEAPFVGPGQEIDTFTFGPHSLAVLFTNGSLAVLETATGQERLRFEPPKQKKLTAHDPYQVALALSPDGRYLAVARDGHTIELVNLVTGEMNDPLEGHEGTVISLQFTLDSRQLVSGSLDTTALVWDLAKVAPPWRTEALEDASLEQLWTDLEGTDVERAYRSLAKLSRSAEQAVKLAANKVRPATPPDLVLVARLLEDSNDDRFEVRQKASQKLESMGELIETPLRDALAKATDLDRRRKLEVLLDRMASRYGNPSRRREGRTLELLELIGGEAARKELTHLASGATDAYLTRDAKNVLERMTGRQ